MKLRVKTALVVGITMFLFLALLFLIIRPILLEDSIELDKRLTLKDIDRVGHYIQSELKSLNDINRDWSKWDDTYLFVQNKKPDYQRVNLLDNTFEFNGLNFIVFYDKNSKLFYQKAYDLQNKRQLSLKPDFYKNFLSAIKTHNNSAIFVKTDLGLSMVSIQMVQTSNEQSPSAGTMIMGKLVNQAFVEEMGKNLNLNLFLKENDYKNSRIIQSAVPISDMKLRGTLFLPEYTNSRTCEISFVSKRSFYLQKKESFRYLFIYLALTCFIIIMLILYLLNRFILSRIHHLSSQLKIIQDNKDLKARINSPFVNDEISMLEQSINQMLSSLEEKHDEVRKLAMYDQLTGIPNRYLFFEVYAEMHEQYLGKFAVVFFDLNGFKRVNDSFGHNAGDTLLKMVSAKVIPVIKKKNGFIARYGGDEFVILLKYIEESSLEMDIRDIMNTVGSEFQLRESKISVTTSMGISTFPADGSKLEQLLKNADIAMYEAKRKGNNQYLFYHNLTVNNSYMHILELENDLKYALSKKQFELYYQIIVNGHDRRIAGVEALLRWNHPLKGIIPPDKFIPVAEQAGLMPDIGLWVLEEALKQAWKWQQEGFEGMTMSINVSKSQIGDCRFIEMLRDTLNKYQFPASKLLIEITESDINHYLDEVLQFAYSVKEIGVKIALDDFGVGTSSLLYLKEIPIDVIKIDRNFVQNIPDHPFDSVLLLGIFEIIKGLNLEVIVEGIERIDQIDFVTSQTLSKLQGYYFSKPQPVETIKNEFFAKI